MSRALKPLPNATVYAVIPEVTKSGVLQLAQAKLNPCLIEREVWVIPAVHFSPSLSPGSFRI